MAKELFNFRVQEDLASTIKSLVNDKESTSATIVNLIEAGLIDFMAWHPQFPISRRFLEWVGPGQAATYSKEFQEAIEARTEIAERQRDVEAIRASEGDKAADEFLKSQHPIWPGDYRFVPTPANSYYSDGRENTFLLLHKNEKLDEDGYVWCKTGAVGEPLPRGGARGKFFKAEEQAEQPEDGEQKKGGDAK